MITYLYDGTFEGLLTVIATALKEGVAVNAITAQGDWQPDLFTEIRQLATDPAVAEEFFQQLQTRFSQRLVLDLGYCFLAEEVRIEKVLLDFIRLVFSHGESISRNVTNPTVMRIRRISDKVGYEIIRMQGFVRFRQLRNGFYYAAIEPDYNIVQFLAPHFTSRFADQQWLIHDVKRNTGISYNRRRCLFIPRVEINQEIVAASQPHLSGAAQGYFTPEEFRYQELWKQYFRETAIAERSNPKLQRKNLPVRYWRYLVEVIR